MDSIWIRVDKGIHRDVRGVVGKLTQKPPRYQIRIPFCLSSLTNLSKLRAERTVRIRPCVPSTFHRGELSTERNVACGCVSWDIDVAISLTSFSIIRIQWTHDISSASLACIVGTRIPYRKKSDLYVPYDSMPTSGSPRPCIEVPSTRLILKLPATRPFAAAVCKVSSHPEGQRTAAPPR
jgi:hypothetical protein